jgi:hypothetical protein
MDGKPCGSIAKIDNAWYFYVLPNEQNPFGAVSHPFYDERGVDARQEVVKLAHGRCPIQGKPVVAK